MCFGIALNGFNQVKEVYKNGGYYWNLNFIDNEIKDISTEFDNITALDIDISKASIKIEKYTGTNIKIEGKKVNENIKITNDNGVLVIEEKDSFSIGIDLFSNNDSGELMIYIPEDYKFTTINIESSVGNVSVDEIKCNDIVVNIDVGDFSANNIVATTSDFDVNLGVIDVKLLDSQDSEFDCDMGNISICFVGKIEDYKYNVKNDMGEIKINGISSSKESDVNSGGGNKRFNVKCDMGKVNIKMRGE